MNLPLGVGVLVAKRKVEDADVIEKFHVLAELGRSSRFDKGTGVE
jgi:hypothetical protein